MAVRINGAENGAFDVIHEFLRSSARVPVRGHRNRRWYIPRRNRPFTCETMARHFGKPGARKRRLSTSLEDSSITLRTDLRDRRFGDSPGANDARIVERIIRKRSKDEVALTKVM